MTPPAWVTALSATLLMQTITSLLTQRLSVLAPLITASAGLSPESIGNLSALVAAGTMLFVLLGVPFSRDWDLSARCRLAPCSPQSR